ncbi:MAG: glycosyltransferase [Pseudomonadota bacterium]
MPVHRPGAWLDDALASIPEKGPGGTIAVIIRDSTPEGSSEALIEPHRERLSIDYEYWPEIASWTRKTNMGVEAASSRYVATLHQDDLWFASRAETIAAMIERHPDAALYLTGAAIVDEKGARLGDWNPPFANAVQDKLDYVSRLLVQNTIAMPSPVWQRDAYLASGGMDENLWYTPDWDLWLKLADQGDVVFDPKVTAGFRIHGSSLTMTGDRSEMARELDAILARYGDHSSRFAALSRASAKVNTALAAASGGNLTAGLSALGAIAGLGPVGAARYLKYSRLIERVWPRVRLRLKGAM